MNVQESQQKHQDSQKAYIEKLKQSFHKIVGVDIPVSWLPFPVVEPVTAVGDYFFSTRLEDRTDWPQHPETPLTLEEFEFAPAGIWLAGFSGIEGREFWHFARKDGRRECFVKLRTSDVPAITSFAVRHEDFALWAEERCWRVINDQGRCSGSIEWRDGRREEMPAAGQEEFRFVDERQELRNDERQGLGMVAGAKHIPRDHWLYKTGWMVGLQTLRPSSDKPSKPKPKLSPEENL